MPSTIKLEIVTPLDVVYSEDINILEAPAMDGLIGILPRHAPLVTGLKTGVLQITKGKEKIFIPISDGFMEVKPELINVIVRTAELPHEIDINRAKEAKERAERRLDENDKSHDFTRAQAALERAVARLKAVEHTNI
ncbi:MAG: F0F1 ATP synthase subunit epsilon [Halanaerobiales bacterium]